MLVHITGDNRKRNEHLSQLLQSKFEGLHFSKTKKTGHTLFLKTQKSKKSALGIDVVIDSDKDEHIIEQLYLLNAEQQFKRTINSPLIIPSGTYLNVLSRVETILPDLLKYEEDWKSVDINYHPPRVERIWKQIGGYRIYLHVIHQAIQSEVLCHTHPWPAAMRLIKGSYIMGVGYDDNNNNLTLSSLNIATCHFAENSRYEMVDPKSLHFVCPKDGPVVTLMVTGCPWPGREAKSKLNLSPLSKKRKEEIIECVLQKKIYHQ